MSEHKKPARKRALQKGGVAVLQAVPKPRLRDMPNKEELKQVELIMKQFLLVDRYSVLLAWCKKMNIKSKRGKDFRRLSIKALLTNPRYIGKWYRNKHNAGKRQNKLMPYERFTEVELGYGCVVDKGLWQKVQGKVRVAAGQDR